jgi:hypothetical protein
MSKLQRLLRFCVVPLALATATLAPIAVLNVQPAGADVSGAAQLDSAAGQYVPITPIKIFDTRSGTGDEYGAGNLTGGESVPDIPVAGFGCTSSPNSCVPLTGATSVFVNIEVLYASASGYITTYSASLSESPGHASLNFPATHPTSGSDIVTLGNAGSSGSGDISIENNGDATIAVAMMVEGYFTDGSSTTPGDTFIGFPYDDTYHGAAWTTVFDSRDGYGSIDPGDSLAVSIEPSASLAEYGVSASDIDGVEIEVGTMESGGEGYLEFSGSDTSVPLRSMTYEPGETERLTDIVQVNPSNGTLEVTNDGTYDTDVEIDVLGYFLNPNTSGVASATYTPLPSAVTVCDTRVGCTGVAEEPVPSDQSITVQVAGASGTGIPSENIGDVAMEINAISAQDDGYLNVVPAGDAVGATSPAVNFVSNLGSGSTAFSDTVLSQTSSAGYITIYNESAGSVDVVISATGYWVDPTSPSPPSDLVASYSGGSATLNWDAPPFDGGSPITSFEVFDTSVSDTTPVDTVTGSTYSDTVSAADGDLFYVQAENVVGPSADNPEVSDDPLIAESSQLNADASEQFPLPSGQSLPTVWSGTVEDPSGNPISAAVTASAVPIDPSNTTAGSTSPSPSDVSIGSGETDANGNFTLQAGPTNAVDSVMDTTTGEFEVFLEVTTSANVYTFSRIMDLTDPSIDGPLLPDTSSTVLSANGLNSTDTALDDVAWSTVDSLEYQNGDVITVDPASAPDPAAQQLNTPLIGPIPEAASSAMPLSFVPSQGVTPDTSGIQTMTNPNGGTFSVNVGQNAYPQTAYNFNVCFDDGVLGRNTNPKVPASVAAAHNSPWDDQGDFYEHPNKNAKQIGIPYELPVVIGQYGLDAGAQSYAESGQSAWAVSLNAGSGNQVGLEQTTSSGATLGPLSWGSSYSAISTKSVTLGSSVSSGTQRFSYEGAIWVLEHPILHRQHCYTEANAIEVYYLITGQKIDQKVCDSSCAAGLAYGLGSYYNSGVGSTSDWDQPRWYQWVLIYATPRNGGQDLGILTEPQPNETNPSPISQEANWGTKLYDSVTNACESGGGSIGGLQVDEGGGFSVSTDSTETNTSETSFDFDADATAAAGPVSSNLIGFSSGSDHSTYSSSNSYDYLSGTANMTGVPADEAHVCFFADPSQAAGGSGGAWPVMPNTNGKRSYGDPVFTW